MTHDEDDGGQHTQVDGQKVADLPFGVHLDTVEVKWVVGGLLAGFAAAASGHWTIVGAFATVAAGGAAGGLWSRLERLKTQPWWAAYGLLLGVGLGTAAAGTPIGAAVSRGVDMAARIILG